MTETIAGTGESSSFASRLFANFDPFLSFATRTEPEFKNVVGDLVEKADETDELFFLAYEAIVGIGNGTVPSKAQWVQACEELVGLIRTSSEVFNWNEYAAGTSERLEAIDWDPDNDGSLEIMLLDDCLSRRVGQVSPSFDAIPWSMLCLMWIDRAVGSLVNNNGASAVDEALRARAALAQATPPASYAQVRTELARAAVRRKLQFDPKQRMKRAAKELWLQSRTEFKKKADIARHIQDRIPDLENMNVVTRLIREWEREIESGTKPAG